MPQDRGHDIPRSEGQRVDLSPTTFNGVIGETDRLIREAGLGAREITADFVPEFEGTGLPDNARVGLESHHKGPTIPEVDTSITAILYDCAPNEDVLDYDEVPHYPQPNEDGSYDYGQIRVSFDDRYDDLEERPNLPDLGTQFGVVFYLQSNNKMRYVVDDYERGGNDVHNQAAEAELQRWGFPANLKTDRELAEASRAISADNYDALERVYSDRTGTVSESQGRKILQALREITVE